MAGLEDHLPPSVVVLNPYEDCSPSASRKILDEILEDTDSPAIESVDAASVLADVRDSRMRALETPATEEIMNAGIYPLRVFGSSDNLGTVTSYFVELQDRKRANLARIAKHDAYLVHEEPDGTLIWEPATVITETERKLLQDSALMAQIAETRKNPDRLRRRDRSGSPRSS